MASSTSKLSSMITPDSGDEISKMQDVSTLSQKEHTSDVCVSENSNFRGISSPYNNQTSNDATSPPPYTDVPQWKKELIQRRKINIAKTNAANQSLLIAANSTKAAIDALSPTSDSKKSLIFANKNNSDKLTMRASNANTTHATEINASQHSSAVNVNNMLKKPATIQQQDEIESSCGGHYTQVNNKSSGGSHKYNEKSTARTASVIQQEQLPLPIPMTQSWGIIEPKQNSNDSNPISVQENTRFRKNPTEQHEATNTTSFDSLTTSTSRLSSCLKVAAAAEIYKKSNKDHLGMCMGEQQAHTLQEPALTTHVSNNNGNGGGDDDQQLHHQLKSEHESDNLACASVNVTSAREADLKLFPINNANGIITLSPKGILNKQPCGTPSASVKSLPLPLSLQFVKNQNIGNSTLVSSHHNYKINTKYRLNQNTSSSLPVCSTSSVIESPTTVTNNKKKMVAVQEMNEIGNNELDFDPSEELQYGPGIVSKLRCRYLSLALRQSVDKQRLSMDTLRRATSLNNLLDDNDVHDEDEDEDDTVDANNKVATSQTAVLNYEIGIKENSAMLNDTVVDFKKNIKNQRGERITTTAYNNNRSRHIKRGNDSLKRARSVEALLCEKSPWNFSNSQPTMLSNGGADSVTIEDKINSARDRLLTGCDNPPRRLTSIIDDTERPPPDLVKQTLKIFEASANRRGRVLNRNCGGEVATKVANYKTIITQNKPAITFPKPPVSPKKSNLKKNLAEVKNTHSTPPTTINAIPLMHMDNNLVPISSTPAASSHTTVAFHQKMDFTPIRNVGCVSGVGGLSENSPDIIPRHKLFDKTLLAVIAVDSPVTELTKKIEKLQIESPAPIKTEQQQPPRKELQSRFSTESSDCDSEDDDSIDGEYVVNNEECGLSKNISNSALENIAKAGTSQQFKFQTKSSGSLSNGNSHAEFSEPLHDIPTLSTAGATTVKQIGVIRPLLVEPQHIENSCKIEENSFQTTSTLTSREIEKNRINNEKKIEKSGTNNSMDDLECVGFAKLNKNIVSTSPTNDGVTTIQAPAWSSAIITKKKRTPVAATSENNTMVFNFKDRKEVPDYIENDGLIFKRKRELPKPNESGFVLLGDLSLETSTDPEDEWPMCPPSPCDVEFENANIIIDGKSSIKNRTKEVNFRVQFNDTLTSTFEYPSESSVIEESGSEYADLSSNALYASSSTSATLTQTSTNASLLKDSSIIHHHVTVEEIIQLPHNNKVLGNLLLGSAPLGSYIPVKAKIENIFQLGVTRVPSSQSDQCGNEIQPKEVLPADIYGELDDPSLEYLKPASDDLTIAYSEGSLKTDLLY